MRREDKKPCWSLLLSRQEETGPRARQVTHGEDKEAGCAGHQPAGGQAGRWHLWKFLLVISVFCQGINIAISQEQKDGRVRVPVSVRYKVSGILLKCTWNISRIDHVLGHKVSLGKLKKIEIMSSIFSDHKAMRLEVNLRKDYKKKTKKHKHVEAKQYAAKQPMDR